MPPNKLVYTAGYCDRSSETLYRGAIALGATVVDIRYSGGSKTPEWDSHALQELMGGYYRHLPAWGNVNYKDRSKPIVINDYNAGFAQFEAMSGTVILLCFCPKFHNCHRAAICRMIDPLGYKNAPFHWEAYQLGSEQESLF